MCSREGLSGACHLEINIKYTFSHEPMGRPGISRQAFESNNNAELAPEDGGEAFVSLHHKDNHLETR